MVSEYKRNGLTDSCFGSGSMALEDSASIRQGSCYIDDGTTIILETGRGRQKKESQIWRIFHLPLQRNSDDIKERERGGKNGVQRNRRRECRE